MIRTALKNPYLVIVHVLIVAVMARSAWPGFPADCCRRSPPRQPRSSASTPDASGGMEQDIMSRLQRWTGQSWGIEHQEAKAMQGVCVVKDFFHPNISHPKL
ncbi:MAG: hypothetical protein Ct9H300mP1_39450 [Planctomycetaceae bacterium]|nr:MAG: hypothetical protein Ct9H300mP1_39450 [Planctomycetaceae bacterium]